MVAVSNQIDIDSEQVLRNIGYETSNKLPARVVTLVGDYLEYINNLIDPSYSCVIRDIKLVQGAYTFIEGSVLFKSKVIARLLDKCQKVAVFAMTIGDFLEETVSQLAEDGLVLQATVLDAIGSAAVESVADYLQNRIKDVAEKNGLCISQRFSPGYCDWNVNQQKMIFEAMNEENTGVVLTEGCLMIPQKSISGIIGIGPCDNGIETYDPCSTCLKEDCPGRRSYSTL